MLEDVDVLPLLSVLFEGALLLPKLKWLDAELERCVAAGAGLALLTVEVLLPSAYLLA